MVFPEYRRAFDDLIERLRTERATVTFLLGKPDRWASEREYAIARETLFGLDPDSIPCPSVGAMVRGHREWRRRRDRHFAELRARTRPRQPKKPYVPWSRERLQQNQLRLLQQKLGEAFSIPQLYWDALQTQLAERPWRYGVCQICGDRCSAPPYETRLRKARAVAYENELRASGE